MNSVQTDHISVCVCTFKRPALLQRLLEALAVQATEGFSFNVVVIDNDAERSAEDVVRRVAVNGKVHVRYDVEAERNISLARNRAVRNAEGQLAAFIDDDECPRSDWLLQLYRTFTSHRPDGVLGPVLPDFSEAAPSWLKRGGVFQRRRLATGERIGEGDGRTGNLLLRRSIFTEDGYWFDPAFGRTGGEDSDFFHRQFEAGGVFVWCDEADVTEEVPAERWTVGFHVRRLLRAGTTDGELMKAGKLPDLVFRNVAVFVACAALAIPALLLPKHLRVRVLQKCAYSGGLVAAYAGFPVLRYRD